MPIERTLPLSIHKNLVIRAIESDPSGFRDIVGATFETAEEAIEAIREHEGTWIVDGQLRTEAEHRAYVKEKYGVDWEP